MVRKSSEVAHELEITRWVEWFRGVNDPAVQWKVAERQLNMLKAEKRITHWEIAYETRGRPPRVILYAANAMELEQLEDALEKVFPKVPRELPPVEDEEDGPLQAFLKKLGEARARKGRR
jgi:hypothetical protein